MLSKALENFILTQSDAVYSKSVQPLTHAAVTVNAAAASSMLNLAEATDLIYATKQFQHHLP